MLLKAYLHCCLVCFQLCVSKFIQICRSVIGLAGIDLSFLNCAGNRRFDVVIFVAKIKRLVCTHLCYTQGAALRGWCYSATAIIALERCRRWLIDCTERWQRVFLITPETSSHAQSLFLIVAQIQ